MENAGLDELQAGIKTGGRNINNLRYVDDTILMVESEEELKSPLMRVKEESERASLKLNIKKKKKKTKIPGVGSGNPLQYSCLENAKDREAWQARVHGVTESRT